MIYKHPISELAQQLIRKEQEEKTGKLDLGKTGLTEIPKEIFEMTWLEELTLSNSYFSVETNLSIESNNIGNLNQLEHLPIEISYLNNLKFLSIGGNHINPWSIFDVSPLRYLEKLEILILPYNNISEVDDLSDLINLHTLYLNNNRIHDIGFLKGLGLLKTLTLSSNGIEDIEPITRLRNLSRLILNSNKISNVDSLSRLTNLSHLELRENQIKNISFSQTFPKLKHLNLRLNLISKLNWIEQVRNLNILDLRENLIEEISPIYSLINLRSLFLANNKIKEIDSIRQLKNLNLLNLADNRIKSIEPILDLLKLELFSLKGNSIKDCPIEIVETDDITQIRAYFDSQKRESKKQEQKINKKGKPKSRGIETSELVSPSPEVVEESVLEKIEFSSEIEDPNFDLLHDVKVIFVGNSGVGKTQLSEFFENNDLNKKRKSTHGLRLERWLPTGKESEAFQKIKNNVAVNIWDFGGQEYYHGTYRLFLSNYAVYILLWEDLTNVNKTISTQVEDGKENEELQHYHYKYWLDNIRHYADDSKNSRLLIVQNKVDRDEKRSVNTQLLNEYNIHSDHYISLHEATEGDEKKYKWNFDILCDALANCIEETTDNTKTDSWLKVRDAIINLREEKISKSNPFKIFLKDRKYIEINDFEKACLKIDPNFEETELYTLPRWLHTSGCVIYFGGNEELKDRVFLDPTWVANGIYEILKDSIRAKDGEFKIEDISTKSDISIDTFIALMKQLEIIFEKSDESDHYVAPQYLPDTHAVEDLYAIASKGLQQKAYYIRLPLFFYRKVLQRMIFYYGYDKNVQSKYYWKQGILFEKDGTRVMFKGFIPDGENDFGIFMIGAEEVGNYRAIQKEVFDIIFEILDGTDLISLQEGSLNFENQQMQNISNIQQSNFSSLVSNIYSRPQNWTKQYESQSIPRWLKVFDVSLDGKNFINYLELNKANHNEDKFISNNESTRFRIYDFELLLDKIAQEPLKVFFSYSHKDTNVMNRLSVHLGPLKRMKKIEIWSDTAIKAGDDWNESIQQNLESSDIILFLVSADFVASQYIWKEEIPAALELARTSKTKVIPIYLRPLDYRGLNFTDKQMIPSKNGKLIPISLWDDEDEAFMEVAKEIKKVIEAM